MHPINKERLISTFMELASISSPSWKEHEVLDYITDRFTSLGIPYKKHVCSGSFNLLATARGTSEKKPILLSAHTDTVVPCDSVKPVISGNRIMSDGTSILGSDDKAAIAMFIEALEIARETRLPHGPVEILLSCAEELGLLGIKNFDMGVIKSKRAFVFDSGGRVGKIVIKAPYHSSMEITIKGKAAHAGMEPEKGISAISVLAAIIAALPNGRIDDVTTMNVGIISGGRATNIVAEEAFCKLEVRSIDKKKMLMVEKKIRETISDITKESGARAVIHRELEYPGFSISEESDIAKFTCKALTNIGIRPEFEISGGGSDTNILNRAGIRAINLSCGMQKVHTTGEFITIKDLVNGTRLVLSLIEMA